MHCKSWLLLVVIVLGLAGQQVRSSEQEVIPINKPMTYIMSTGQSQTLTVTVPESKIIHLNMRVSCENSFEVTWLFNSTLRGSMKTNGAKDFTFVKSAKLQVSLLSGGVAQITFTFSSENATDSNTQIDYNDIGSYDTHPSVELDMLAVIVGSSVGGSVLIVFTASILICLIVSCGKCIKKKMAKGRVAADDVVQSTVKPFISEDDKEKGMNLGTITLKADEGTADMSVQEPTLV